MAAESRAPKPGGSRRFLRHLNVVAVLLVIAAAAGLLLSPADDQVLLGLPELTAGDVAPLTIKSPREFEIRDVSTEDRLRAEAIARVRPTYDLVGGLGVDFKRRIEAAFAAIATGGEDPAETSQDFMREIGLFFNPEEYATLGKAGFTPEFRDAAIMAVRTIYESRIAEDRALLELQAPTGIKVRVLDPNGAVEREEDVYAYTDVLGLDQARAHVDKIVATRLEHLDHDTGRAVSQLAKRFLRPNLLPNPAETDRRQVAAGRTIKPLFIRIKIGEVVTREGERVTDRDEIILAGISRDLESQNRFAPPVAGAAVIVLFVIALFLFSGSGRRPFLPGPRDVALAGSLYVGALITLWVGYTGALWGVEELPLFDVHAYHFLVPVAWAALVVRFVLGVEAAAAFLPLIAITAGWVMDMSIGYTIYTLVGGLAAATLRSTTRPKLQMLYAGFWCGLWQAAIVLLLAIHENAIETARFGDVVAALGSGLLAALIALITIPIIEALFGYTTSTKLTEWANLNHPLLRDLLVQAPGTYHHSIVVGALAEAGARVIGEDALLARVGGYYHDVGKLKNPSAFRENNRGGFTHQAPADQATELRRHVAEGLEIASRHRLGRPIMEIIAQHHGTSSVRDLERKALESATSGAPMDMSAFRYAGPRPISRVAGLVMLADVVEAAVNSLVAQAPLEDGSLETNVRLVIDEVVGNGQLDDCDLSLSDIRAAQREFVVVLREMLLRRSRPPTTERSSPEPVLVRPPFDDRPN